MSNLAMMMGLGSAEQKIPVEFVGSGSNIAFNGTSVTVDLSSIDIQSGDLILVGFFVGEDADRRGQMNLTSTGYTEITSLYGQDTYHINMKTYGKFADGTETNFITAGGIISTASTAVIVSVFRNAGDVLPTDEATGLAASGTNVNTDDIVWPEVTGVSANDTLVYFGATGHVSGAPQYTDPTDLTDFTTLGVSDSEDVTCGYGYKLIDSGPSFSANTWLVSANGTSSSVAYTVFKL